MYIYNTGINVIIDMYIDGLGNMYEHVRRIKRHDSLI